MAQISYYKTLQLCLRNAEREYSYNLKHCPLENLSTNFGIPNGPDAMAHERQFGRYLDNCPELAQNLHMITRTSYKRLIRNAFRKHHQASDDSVIEHMYGVSVYMNNRTPYKLVYNKSGKLQTVEPTLKSVNLSMLMNGLTRLSKEPGYQRYISAHAVTTARIRGCVRHLWHVISKQSEGMTDDEWQSFNSTLPNRVEQLAKRIKADSKTHKD